jgi:hypothetical protein
VDTGLSKRSGKNLSGALKRQDKKRRSVCGTPFLIKSEDLFPNMPVPVFAFEQLAFGEALKAKGCDVHGSRRAVEDEFDEAGTRRGGSFEACAAQPARKMKSVQPGSAIDSPLVRGNAIAPNMDGV